MASKDTVSHIGKIVDITPEITTVEIISESACSSCHAALLCGMSENKRKLVEVRTTLGGWEVGQEVQVLLRRTMGLKAVWIGYVIPLIILMVVLLTLSAFGCAELLAGLLGIGAVAVYYLVIYILRNKLRNEWSFSIKEK